MKYLENPICNFTPLFKIDYKKKKNLISTCFFKMAGGGYKSFSKYLNGIQYLSKYVEKEMKDFTLRVFIDHSIYNDKGIMDKLKKCKNIELVIYQCPNYQINGNKHKGTFGTIVRFFPMFNFKNNDSDVVIISDIDFDSYNNVVNKMDTIKSSYEELKKNNRLNELYFLIWGRLFHDALHNKFFYKNKIIPYALAWKIINIKKMDGEVIINYLKKIEESENILSNYKTPKKVKNSKFIFGIDEYLLNHNIKDYVFNKEFGVKLKYSLTDNIFFLKNKKNPIYKRFLEYVLEGSDKIKNYKDLYDLLDKYVWIEYSNKKLTTTQINIFFRIYIFYMSIYHNKKYIKYFNKDFLDIVLNDIFLGTIHLTSCVFYNSNKKNLIIKKITLPENYIEKLKELKKKFNIRNRKIDIIDNFEQ